MQSLLPGLAVLACPVGMGAMMWMMMRDRDKNTGDIGGQNQQQVEQLRIEIDQLKAERAMQRTNELREEIRALRAQNALDSGRVPSSKPIPPAAA